MKSIYRPPTKKTMQDARKAVSVAVKAGKLIKLPCEYADCTEIKSEAHHPNYYLQLSVVWLCHPHHMELHRYLRAEK